MKQDFICILILAGARVKELVGRASLGILNDIVGGMIGDVIHDTGGGGSGIGLEVTSHDCENERA